MSWRSVQLGIELCDQDRKIIELFGQQPVQYVGSDLEFAAHLNCVDSANNLVLVINYNRWLSEIVDTCRKNLTDPIDNFYIGINRYCVKGNDTNTDFNSTGNAGADLINIVKSIADQAGYVCLQSGHHDKDLGRYFNFIQPLTWVYGTKKTNTSY